MVQSYYGGKVGCKNQIASTSDLSAFNFSLLVLNLPLAALKIFDTLLGIRCHREAFLFFFC